MIVMFGMTRHGILNIDLPGIHVAMSFLILLFLQIHIFVLYEGSI